MKLNSSWLRALLFRLVLFSVLWWGLSEGSLPYLLPACLFIAGAAGVSLWCVRPGMLNIRPGAIPGFIGFFLVQSFWAGLDVAGRAFQPRIPLELGIISYTLRLRRTPARLFFVWIVSLLPGTASVSLEEKEVLIHVLDTEQVHQDKLRSIEDRLESLFE